MIPSSDILVLPLDGDLDVSSTSRVRTIIDTHIAKGCRRIVINMAEATYVDSMGVALLFTTARRLHELGGLLSLVSVPDAVYRTLAICRMVDFIPVSGMGPKPPIPALDSSIRPLWQGTMNVDPGKLSSVRQRIEQVLSNTDLTPEEIFDLTLAGGEALGNAIDHTCADGVLCSIEVYPDRVIVEVSDCGEGFDTNAPCETAAHMQDEGEDEDEAQAPENLERGRGIKLMRMLADSVEIQHKSSGDGTVVRLIKLYTPIEMQHKL